MKAGKMFIHGHNGRGRPGPNNGKRFPKELYPNFGPRGKKYPKELYPNHIGTRGKTFPKEIYPNYGMRGKTPWNKNLTARMDPRVMTKATGGGKAMKLLWQNLEYRDKTLRAILKGLFKRPTSLEKKGIYLHQKYDLPFLYCGNGTFLIGFKNPDFRESNNKKLCLEYANRFHHPGDYESKRVAHFAKYGWKCLVIWEEEMLNPDKVAARIGAFIDANRASQPTGQ